VLGPSIHACCYEFGEAELERVAFGIGVPSHALSGRTSDDKLALDVPAAVREALARHNVRLDTTAGCTGCDGRWFSHRVRSDGERHAVVAWTENATIGQIEK
jgi:copper oxidase (laccase) domain-containing protein